MACSEAEKARSRRRYAEDPVYREKHRAYNKMYYWKHKALRDQPKPEPAPMGWTDCEGREHCGI